MKKISWPKCGRNHSVDKQKPSAKKIAMKMNSERWDRKGDRQLAPSESRRIMAGGSREEEGTREEACRIQNIDFIAAELWVLVPAKTEIEDEVK